MAALLGTWVLIACPTVASAHADYIASSPGNGATVSKAPGAITVKFNESITLNTEGVRILNGAGAPLSVSGSSRGNTITIKPGTSLVPGRYAVA